MEKSVESIFTDGTICENCGFIVLTKIGLAYLKDNKTFCCKECSDKYKKSHK